MTGNQLDNALSPYLLQHADNPVHWLEWSSESLALARRLDRPILLSIGYSACHWCHVMAHESFESDEIAEQMNRDFVSIKVDREERPDLDRIYQLAHQLLTGRGGGWPLTVFLDPQSQAPFFAGTYFPPEPRTGLISFGQLLERIADVWASRRDELRDQQLQVQQALKAISQPRAADEISSPEELADTLVAQLVSSFDQHHAGFGAAPKFPQSPLLALLAAREDDDQASQMLSDTLQAIVNFGLRDHIGGGFFRYCVDEAWEIPHFEKMLSDNALLLGLLTDAAVRWPHRGFKEVSRELVDWLNRDMAIEGGGFAASLDADTDDGEGAFYVWSPDQFRAALVPSAATLSIEAYGLDGPPNFNDKRWHPIRVRDLDELTSPGRNRDQVEAELARARTLLLQARSQRAQPARDDKLIASWNGLAIEQLARAGRLLNEPEWVNLAADSLDAVAVRLFGQEPPRAVWRNGRSAHPAMLDDHTNVLLACLELLQSRFESRWFNLARRLARRIDRQFVDEQTGACFLTPLEHEALVTRPLALSDDATPAGAAQAVRGIVRLGHLCGDADLLKLAKWILAGAAGDMASAPMSHAGLIEAALVAAEPSPQVLIGGPDSETDAWLNNLTNRRNLHVYRIDPDQALEEPPRLIQSVQQFDRPTAVVCAGMKCLAPVHTLNELDAIIASL